MQDIFQRTPLFYKYPFPTKDILYNIQNCILKFPEFYIKICHLMNLMNLPIPFKSCKKKYLYLDQVLIR